MGRNIDAALALSMIYGLGRGRLIAAGISNSSLDAAAFVEGLARFYMAGVLPIGLAEDGPRLNDAPMLSVPLAARRIRDVTDTADPAVVFRNGLLTQQDQQAIAVLAGPATNLARTLILPGARDIVAAKVRLLVMAAGEFRGGRVDPRIRADVASARKLLAEWPSPLVAVGMEAGSGALSRSDNRNGICRIAESSRSGSLSRLAGKTRQSSGWRRSRSTRVGRALCRESNAEYFKLSASGAIEVNEDGRTRFTESSDGKHRFLVVDPAQKTSLTQAFITLVTAKPATGRGAPPPN